MVHSEKSISKGGANQSKAAKAAEALATLHTLPKQILELRKTASATNPANQNVMATPSTAMRAYCGAAVGNTLGGHIDESENGPDACKDQKVDLAGRHIAPVVRPPVGDCMKMLARADDRKMNGAWKGRVVLTIGCHSKHDNRTESLSGPEAHYNFSIHPDQVNRCFGVEFQCRTRVSGRNKQ